MPNLWTSACAVCAALLLQTAVLAVAEGSRSSSNSSSSSSSGGCNLQELLSPADFTGPLPCALANASHTGEAAAAAAPRCESLTGKVVLVTGGSTGVGRAVAERLAAAGMRVVGTSRTPDKYMPPGSFQLWQLDQTSQDSVNALLRRMNDTFGHIDFLHLNAGRWFLGDLRHSSVEAMHLAVETNFWGPLRVLRAALPLLPTQGYGRILVSSSIDAFYTEGFMLPYAASKAALSALAEEWEVEQRLRNDSAVRFTTLYLGPVRTNLINNTILGCPELEEKLHNQVFRGLFEQAGIEAAAAGEAVYRIALDPAPAKRYLLVNPLSIYGTSELYTEMICRRLTQPMERWWEPGYGADFLSLVHGFMSQFTCPTPA